MKVDDYWRCSGRDRHIPGADIVGEEIKLAASVVGKGVGAGVGMSSGG